MLINVKNLALEPIDFDFQEEIAIPRSGGDVPCKVKVTGTVQRVDRNYVVEGEIAAVLSLNCDKCLSAFEAQLDLNMNEVFSEDVDSEKEFWELSDKTVDLKPAVIADIMLNMPMKAECPKCGHNLNEGDCGCDRGYINPQFEKLLTLFKDDDEEV